MNSDIPDAAYVHIPFCRRRCYYCDFPISVVGDRTQGDNSGAIAQYITILCQEILTTPALGKTLQTVFFGGGTPSLLSVGQLKQILQTLDQQFGIAASAEISIEIDPGTFDLAQLQGYRAAGINRVSLGVQAFQPELLQVCGRSHTANDVYTAVELIHRASISNFSLDLISGLPHQTLEPWQESLSKAIALQPTHLSVYDLIVEPVTAFGRQYKPGAKPLPSDEMTAQMYRLADQVLSIAGYEHYEISNYARSGYQCRHNRVYWENRPYYGFGMGAASYVQGQRFTRPRTRREYFRWVEELVKNEGAIACPQTPAPERLLDTLMLGLRLSEGLRLTDLAQQFGGAAVDQILLTLKPYFHQGWVELFDAETCCLVEPNFPLDQLSPAFSLRLRKPEGFLFSNTVLTALFEQNFICL
ncbi:MAG: coproporphyrinogen III oxidase [Leptolyngbyaceae cyanobacterium SL_5_9]|nr:coproporphyrinogen III oxidase [Leptolyngbyaceae cyanobacterium SL_5_9]NJO74857.1 coproporphyrinogen III oxidase [Leptolyngbyaceae cyanobacterium RM1_406_9]